MICSKAARWLSLKVTPREVFTVAGTRLLVGCCVSRPASIISTFSASLRSIFSVVMRRLVSSSSTRPTSCPPASRSRISAATASTVVRP